MRRLLYLFVFVLMAWSCSSDNSDITPDSPDSGQEEPKGTDDPDDTPEEEEPTVVNNPPGSFNLLTILDLQEDVPLADPEFSWQPSIDPDEEEVLYTFLFDEGTDLPKTIMSDNLSDTSFLLDTVLPRNTSYSWQVVASDPQGAVTASEVFSFTTRPLILSQLTPAAEFDGREEHTSVVFNGKVWIIGGVDTSEPSDDIWSSTDGQHWVKETNNAGFVSRAYHASVVFNGKMWLVGGVDRDNELYNDVWSSEDGINWIQEKDNTSFAGRYNHTLLVYNNKMWLIAGRDFENEFSDVWSSEDGQNWVLETEDAGFPSRQGHTSVAFNDRMFVIGGINANNGSGFGRLNDVWSSTDGKIWKIETVDAEFTPRFGHATTVHNGRIWVVCGMQKTDFWSSADGVYWTNEEYNVQSQDIFMARSALTGISFDGQILIIGGNSHGSLNDVWSIQE